MPISFPTNPSSGDTYDYGGIHYIFNNDGWVNKSIYGISAGTNISFSNYNGTGPIVISATDTTGITSAVTSFNGKTGAVQGVSSFAGLTGTVGSGITTNGILYFDGSDVQGSALLTFDGSDIVLDTSGHFDGNMLGRSEVYIKADEAINEGDPVYVTGSVGASERLTVAKADSAISAKMPAAGIAAQSLALNAEGVMIINGWVRDYDTTGLTANQTLFVASGGGLTTTRPTSAGVLVQNIARVGRPNSANGSIIVTGASRTNDVPNALRVYQYIEMPDGFTFNTVVSSFNGSTGPVTFNNYVSSFNGNTGAIQGVSSINGSTGAITNVAFRNVGNAFTSPQTITSASPGLIVVDSSSFNEIDLIADTGTIYFYNDSSGGEVNLKTNFTATTVDVTLPNYTTTLAGLAGTQTFTGSKTFSSQANFSAGISASGATFNGNIVLQNNEIIRNTTNGRIDLMPAPTGTTHFGIYFDTTGWGYGVQIGTIRSSDNALNQENILWNVPLVIGTDTNFTIGSSSAYRMRQTTTGNDTLQIALAGGGYASTNSNSLALVDVNGLGNANRSPGTTHANPNLYIYANGSASANDFMRLEHGRTAGLIQTGGTSGLTLAPGSGILGISGSFTASGATFSGNISAPNIVNNFGGATGGITFGGYMLTWGGLTSSYDILPLGYNSMSSPIATLPTVNNAYFCPIFINRNLKIKTIGHQTGSSGAGNTGQMMFGLYSSDNYGYPDVKLYNSSGITLSTGAFATQRATVDYDVSPGLYWLAIIWSAIGSSTNGYGRLGGRITTLTNINTTSVIGQTTTHNLRRNMGGFTFTNVSGATFTEVTGTDSVCIFYTSEYRA